MVSEGEARAIALAKEGKHIEAIREFYKAWRCDACKQGKPCPSRDDTNAPFRIEYQDGTTKYFCWPGCALLELSDFEMFHTIVSQYNRTGTLCESKEMWEKLKREQGKKR